jgi:hypothetical protein
MDELSPNIVPALAAIAAIIFVVLLVSVQVARVLKRRHLLHHGEIAVARATQENAKQATRPGAELFLRYDPADPRTFSIDSFAMGHGDPYERLHKMLSQS